MLSGVLALSPTWKSKIKREIAHNETDSSDFIKKSGKFYGAVNRTDGVTATEQRMVCYVPKGAILANEYCAAYTC